MLLGFVSVSAVVVVLFFILLLIVVVVVIEVVGIVRTFEVIALPALVFVGAQVCLYLCWQVTVSLTLS